MTSEELKKELLQISADLDRLATSNDNGASWESAAHLRNRSNYIIRSLARKTQALADRIDS